MKHQGITDCIKTNALWETMYKIIQYCKLLVKANVIKWQSVKCVCCYFPLD